jgi:hypothetical protein
LREYNEAFSLYQKIGDQHRTISAYANLAWVNSLQGNLTDAEKNDEAAIALSRQTNSKGEMDVRANWRKNLELIPKQETNEPQSFFTLRGLSFFSHQEI